MLQARDPAHYLLQLQTTRTPKRLLWLDCGAVVSTEQGLSVERWHAGALGKTWYTSKRGERRDVLENHIDPRAMWLVADDFCKPNKRAVLFAYDLPHQMRVSQAMVHLPALGWRLNKIVLERTASWALFRQGKRTLMMCDLKSWAPVELGHIASDLNDGTSPAMVVQAGPEFQLQTCMMRAGVVRDATLQILNWIEGENLGPFRPTGSGQSFGAYRRRFLSHKLLVHDDVGRLQLERAAMWTGRCEAWRHGRQVDGPYVEYDMSAAYCHIAHECDVPTVAAWSSPNPTMTTLEKAMERYSVLAEVTVTTDVPCIPTRMGGRTVWPVGTFNTVLWDPEILLAYTYAIDFKCHRMHRYHRAPALRDFAGWVLDGMAPQEQVYGLVPKRVLKHWSRCLVGRLGLRFRAWEKFGTQDYADLRLVTFIDTDEGTSTDMLIAGHERMLLADMAESTESLPQVPGWVMSECRRRLWDTMAAIGLDNVVYVDTDSMITRLTGAARALCMPADSGPYEWHQKGQYSRLVIQGPRNYTADSSRHVSGLPLTARQVAPLEFSGQVMRSIKESMRAGELDCVANIPRKFVLDAPDLRRQHLPGGSTAPFEVSQPTGEVE